ncbi:hypothetical protein Mterra_01614 [Calidithermus terrae]|uniref:Uncharacterized protein n=1 Tax=Calidithermus terrae TaxID=1408545 RepID=A0A399EMA1_9DEIN|nr:hypothetical protein [Calidithermus terrae]RIH85757.1 hypothetical protein Mterra_01614 [Calidithermus terrae]
MEHERADRPPSTGTRKPEAGPDQAKESEGSQGAPEELERRESEELNPDDLERGEGKGTPEA